MGKLSHLQKLAVAFAPPGKQAEVLAAMEASQPPPKPPSPPGAPAPPTTPDDPFGVDDSAATARFIVQCNERRLAGCPTEPTDRAAKFIVAANSRRLAGRRA